tara:strand:- start:522 stop:713 length:192 start_codon:yes stop_codon:yes gene_type:complete
MKSCENWDCWKSCIELALKVIFVGFFAWGVMNAVCCMKSCNDSAGCSSTKTSCSKTEAVDTAK